MNSYRVNDHCVKVTGERFELNSNERLKNKKVLKIQIDSNISSQIGPKEVLEALKRLEKLEEERTVRIKGREYTLVLIKNKSQVFLLGRRPKETFNFEDCFLGTVHVSQTLEQSHSRLVEVDPGIPCNSSE